MKNKLWSLAHGDTWIKILILVLLFASCLFVYTSTSPMSYKTSYDTSSMLFSHLFKIILSAGVLIVFSRLSVRVTFKSVEVLYILSIALLMVVKFFGTETNGASRWLDLGFMSFQPSELAKVVFVMYLAKQLSLRQRNYVKIILAFVLIVGLIFVENGSTGLLLLITGLFICVIAEVSIPWKYLLAGIAVLSVLGVILIQLDLLPRLDTWYNRFDRFFSGEADIQSDYAKIAVASGGLWGEGIGESDMKNFLPLSFADYIFAIILEEKGLFALIVSITVYGLLFKRIRDYALMCENRYEAYLLMGLSFMYTLQAVVHMFVNVGLFPVTGQTLPMVSWGGTSGIFVCMAYGTILSITHDIKQANKNKIE